MSHHILIESGVLTPQEKLCLGSEKVHWIETMYASYYASYALKFVMHLNGMGAHHLDESWVHRGITVDGDFSSWERTLLQNTPIRSEI